MVSDLSLSSKASQHSARRSFFRVLLTSICLRTKANPSTQTHFTQIRKPLDKVGEAGSLCARVATPNPSLPKLQVCLRLPPSHHFLRAPLTIMVPTMPAATASPPTIATPTIPSFATLSSIRPLRLPACIFVGSWSSKMSLYRLASA